MRTFKLFFIFAGIIMHISAIAQTVGEKAPKLNFQTILHGGKNANTDKLNGKYILLEFWATWCTPCVRNIPHLNELVDAFNNKPIQFIAVTDEPKEKIELFLQKRKMNGWVAIDNNGQTFKSYKVNGRPTTFIIDKNGVILFKGEPGMVTKQVLNDILSGNYKPQQNENPETESKLGNWGGGQDPVITGNFKMDTMGYLYHDVIRKSVYPYTGSGWRQNNGEVGITLLATNINELMAFTNNLPSAQRVINRSSVSNDAKWDIIFSRKKGYDLEKGKNALQTIGCETFNTAIHEELINKDVLMPVYDNRKFIDARKVADDDPNRKAYQLLSDFFKAIEQKTKQVVDYTDEADNLYVDVFALGNKYYQMSGTELMQWLQKEQGVTFTTEQRKIRMKIISDK